MLTSISFQPQAWEERVHLNQLNPSVGYHDCESFGVVKKGKFFPAYDFNFKLVAEIICDKPSSSGYLVKLTSTGSNITR